MPQEFAELVQHEIDHLDGVLMSDRAVENSQPISRQDYEQNRYKYDAMVDYVIQPTS
jgi:peptide deformylase